MGYILENHRLIGKSSEKKNMGYIFHNYVPHVELAEGIASQE
jgi:hypothetical protein